MYPCGDIPYRFGYWCQHILPLVYDDSLSYYEVLCKLTHFIQELMKDEDLLKQFVNEINGNLEKLTNDFNQFIDDFNSGKFLDVYENAIKYYIDQSVQELVGGIVKYVMFGLTMDGHFCAYIPKSWQFLKFSTITDPDSELYNHLVLSW